MQVFAAWVCASCLLVPALAQADNYGDCAGEGCEENTNFDFLQVTQQVRSSTATPTCPTTVQTSGPTSMGAYNGKYEVFEYEGSFVITATQNHYSLTLGGGSQEIVGTPYVCTNRAAGGWGTHQAKCCHCQKK